ncbi:MAG TPA: hypothetical protein VKB46_05450, partial [Pyrinomonadaceae bacterium]|nr:hypothetical protein [Pyrinomonadaceae bacterium]
MTANVRRHGEQASKLKKPLSITFAALLIAVLLAGLPLLPTSFLFNFQPLLTIRGINLSTLAEEEVGKVLNTVRNHHHYGSEQSLTPGGSRESVGPTFLSLYEFLFIYERLGILSIQDIDEIDRCFCASCSIKVVTGFTCGGWCGGGTTFYLRFDGEAWIIEAYSV